MFHFIDIKEKRISNFNAHIIKGKFYLYHSIKKNIYRLKNKFIIENEIKYVVY